MLAVGTLAPLTVKGQARQGKAENEAASVASEALASIRMVMACGAERPTAEKYGVFVEEAQKQARHLSPITSTQFAITASFIDAPLPIYVFADSFFLVLRRLWHSRSHVLVRHSRIHQGQAGQYGSHHRVSSPMCIARQH